MRKTPHEYETSEDQSVSCHRKVEAVRMSNWTDGKRSNPNK